MASKVVLYVSTGLTDILWVKWARVLLQIVEFCWSRVEGDQRLKNHKKIAIFAVIGPAARLTAQAPVGQFG